MAIINQHDVDTAITTYENSKWKTYWSMGNSVLYNMCSNNPSHTDMEEVAGKIWLIGRTYSAAVERRKNADDNMSNESFYYDCVAPSIVSIGSELDNMINIVKSKKVEDSLVDSIKLHKSLMDKLKEITALDKRSLSSKYLHFHCPDNVFIYDSIAYTAIKKIVTKDKALYNEYKTYGDPIYVDFCLRTLELKEYLEKKTNHPWTIREVDTFLLHY